MNTISPKRMKKIFILFSLLEYNKNSIKYTIWMASPIPLMAMIRVAPCWIHGSPYKSQRPQFRDEARYGYGENFSTDFFFHVWINVGLIKKFKSFMSKRWSSFRLIIAYSTGVLSKFNNYYVSVPKKRDLSLTIRKQDDNNKKDKSSALTLSLCAGFWEGLDHKSLLYAALHLAFLSKVVSKAWTCDLLVTWQQLYQLF